MTDRRNIGASVRARLLERAREQKADFQILVTRYMLERLLYRLSISALGLIQPSSIRRALQLRRANMRRHFSGPIALACASLLLLGGSFAPLTATAQPWGKQVNGLEMTIHLDQTHDQQSKTPHFRVELHNCGENDYVLNLGVMLGNGKKQYPRAVVLNITDSRGKARRFELIEPTFVAGRVDSLIVPLAVDASFSIPVNLPKYWAAASSEFDYKFEAGMYYVEAQLAGTGASNPNQDMAGIGFMPYWQGTVVSNRLQFEVLK